MGGIPAFRGYRGYPASACISINNQVVHGIPSEKVFIRDGDIVSVDVGVLCDGFYGDAAYTYPIGKITEESERLLKITQEALYKGIEQAKPGKRIGDISHAVQKHVETMDSLLFVLLWGMV